MTVLIIDDAFRTLQVSIRLGDNRGAKRHVLMFALMSGKRSEREYKVAAHDLMVESLGREPLEKLIAAGDAGDYSNVCDRAKSVVRKTNMVFHH
jgi:hypothetical protein